MNIVIIYGGQSVEHDVSVLTALHAAKNIFDEINVNLVYLTRTGQMVTSGRVGRLTDVDYYTQKRKKKPAAPCFFAGSVLYKKVGFGGKVGLGVKKVCRVDAVLNCCHGGAGEDGRLAAFFDVLGIPITSCGVRSALDLQSKSRTREVLTHAVIKESGIDQSGEAGSDRLDELRFYQPAYEIARRGQPIKNDIAFPVIVKPDTLGSSIGISVANNREELDAALELAFSMDETAVVEQFLENAAEVNCSVFRYGGKVLTSACEVVNKRGGMFDFDTKYLDSESGFVKKSGSEPEKYEYEDKIKKLAAEAYEIFGASGIVRADFLVVGDKIYLNEINTVPGFLAYHLWTAGGLPYRTLLKMSVEQAVKSQKIPLKTDFSSEILEKNRFLVQK